MDISFIRHPEIKRQFQQFQAALKWQSVMPYAMKFNEEKEKFLKEHYLHINSVLYFNERTGVWYVAMRDPKRIRIVSMTTLTGKEI